MPDRMAELNALIFGARDWARSQLTGRAKKRRRTKPLKHGRRYTYDLGCRCEFCTKANTDYWNAWYKNKKSTDIDKSLDTIRHAD